MEPVTSSYGLIERIKNGDQEAFSVLFAKYRSRLAVLVHYRMGPELARLYEVDDILQDTFLEAFRDFDQFTYRTPGSFMSWLARIADHVLADLARSQGRQKRHAAEMLRFRSESNPAGPEPVDSKTPSRVLAEAEGVRGAAGQIEFPARGLPAGHTADEGGGPLHVGGGRAAGKVERGHRPAVASGPQALSLAPARPPAGPGSGMKRTMTASAPEDSGQEAKQDADGREQLVANAVADYLQRLSQGETLDIDGFCRMHQGLEPDLRAALEAAAGIDAMLEPADPPLPNRPREAELPERLSGHKILSEIGSGGMGRVLLAMDERLGRKVAIKVLSPRFQDNPVLRERFMQEARAMAKLTHPHIAHIYSLGPPEEAPHFVMEYVEGAPLTEASRALTLRQKVELMHKIVLAVDFLHQHQVIHRDLKPGNILVGPDLEPKVLDFGLVLVGKDQENRLTLPGALLGTPDYFSPEQARATAPLDTRSDIFSLGTVFYELLTSELPFRGETLPDQVRRICEEDPALPRRIDSTLPGDLQNICLKALEKSPAHRYASAREMANDLERFLAGEPVLAVPTSYSRLMVGKIDQHLRELAGWKQDHILSEYEFDSFRKLYERLVDREDAWIMAVRRLTLAQVSLYLGAWILVLGAVLVMLFHYPRLSETPSVLVVSAAAVSTAWIGVRCWRQNQRRIAVAYLLAFCLLLPVAWLVMMGRFRLLTAPTHGDETLEFLAQFTTFKRTTNAQLWWSILLSLPAYFWLRRFTRASVFSLVFAVMSAALTAVTLLRMGLLRMARHRPGKALPRAHTLCAPVLSRRHADRATSLPRGLPLLLFGGGGGNLREPERSSFVPRALRAVAEAGGAQDARTVGIPFHHQRRPFISCCNRPARGCPWRRCAAWPRPFASSFPATF